MGLGARGLLFLVWQRELSSFSHLSWARSGVLIVGQGSSPGDWSPTPLPVRMDLDDDYIVMMVMVIMIMIIIMIVGGPRKRCTAERRKLGTGTGIRGTG